MQSSKIITIVVTLSLCGCATTGEPVKIGKDTYLINRHQTMGTAFVSHAEMMKDAMTKANDFCARQGMEANLVESKSAGVPGWTPTLDQDVKFNCMRTDDPKYKVQDLHSPDFITERRTRKLE